MIEPSFRLHYYASLSDLSPEPRLSIKYNFSKKIRFKCAGGVYSQNLIAANSDRDIINLFYGFLSGPENLQETYIPKKGADPKDLDTKLQKAVHSIAGFELDVLNNIEINIEGYQKWFTHLTNLNRDKIFNDDVIHTSYPDSVKKDFIPETGWARGVDFTVKYEKKRLYCWITYSLGFNERWDGSKSYKPIWDRRHNVNLVASYTLGKKKRWEINARWNYGSGFPFTQTQGFYPKLNLNSGLDQDYTTLNSGIGYIPAGLNQGRLPQYHRLDLGVKYKYNISDKLSFEINAGITNAYNRANIFYFDRITQKRKDQLPFLPNLNLNINF